MSTAPMILLVNHWHDDNKGDSAITGGILRLLRERWPAATIRVATLHEAGTPASATQVRHLAAAHAVDGEPSFAPTEIGSGTPGSVTAALRWLRRMGRVGVEIALGRVSRRTRRRLEGVDLVIVVGGSNIYDNPDVRTPMSLARLAGMLYPAWAAAQLGIPVVLAGHTLGPFPRRSGAALARRMLRGVDRAALRESTSLPVAQRLGLRTASVRPDMAFATAADRTTRVGDLFGGLADGGAATVALVLRTHPHAGEDADRQVAEAVAEVGRRLIADGRAGSLLVMAHTLGPTPVEDDRPAARRLLSLLGDQPARLVEEDLSAEELAALYGGCVAVVSVRLHAAILALAHGTPAFSIAYMTRKTEGVMTEAGLPDAWCAYDDAAAERILDALPDLLGPATRERLNAARSTWLQELRAERDLWPLR
ncbi:MAG: colanic acid/amylovoran biosynthesis protein [Baekduia sp.]|jgi:polysaccharide pyruvyl transferase WcaK-like protein|nr:colanic acid/amylovoran biosynthesis protein [Baekduia sp.]